MSSTSRFRVRCFDAVTAQVLDLTIDAPSQTSARQHADVGGRLVLAVDPQADSAPHGGQRAGRAALDVAWWCRELRTLVSAGMTVVEALETLQQQGAGDAREALHGQLVGELHRGKALSAAMQSTGAFPAVLVAGVKAGERSGALLDALDDYLRYHGLLEALRRQVVSASLYPVVVVSLGFVVSTFLLAFVLPRFAQMYGEGAMAATGVTLGLLAFSRMLAIHGPWFALGLVLLLTLALWAWHAGQARRAGSWLLEHVGPLRRRVDEFRLAKLYHSLALMFRGGYALNEALDLCAALGLGPRLTSLVQVAQAGLNRGQRVSDAFGDAGLTDLVSRRLLVVGERSGQFDRVLQTVADRHASRFSTFVERGTRLVEPILLLLVALVVGSIVVLMYMPVFDMAGSVR